MTYCWYCGSALRSKSNRHPARHRVTRDHQNPRARGGTAVNDDGSGNVVLACAECNVEKGCLTLEEYRAIVAIREGSLKNIRDVWTFFGELSDSDKHKFVTSKSVSS